MHTQWVFYSLFDKDHHIRINVYYNKCKMVTKLIAAAAAKEEGDSVSSRVWVASFLTRIN